MPLKQTGWIGSSENREEFVVGKLKHHSYGTEVVAMGSVGSSLIFAALKHTGNGLIHIKRVELEVSKKVTKADDPDKKMVEYTFSGENELENDVRCPTFLLSLASPYSELERAYTIGWQGKKWRHDALSHVAEVRCKNRRVFSGDLIEFDEPLKVDGHYIRQFVVYSPRNGVLSLCMYMNGKFHYLDNSIINNWQNKIYTVIVSGDYRG